MKQPTQLRYPLARRSLLRGVIGVTAATVLPSWQSYAGEALAGTGEKIILGDADLLALQSSIGGSVILPTNPSYHDARKLWNPAIDHLPALIVKCESLEDVQAALQFGQSHNVLTAIRCGGHNYGGTGMADGGMTVDISAINGVEVDASKKVALVSGGSLLQNLDRATVPLGLATTAGVVSHTGVGGLATGLGQGRMARKLGYTIDNIRGLQVMTLDGKIQRANAEENSDLYWGVRGGGGNFGIVTEFQLQLHEIDPNVMTFSYTYPIAKAADVIKTLFELGEHVPNEMSLGGGINTNGEGKTTVSISATHIGSPESAKKIIGNRLDHLGEPIGTRFGGIDYLRLQGIADGTLLSTRSVYSKSGFFNHVDDRIAESIAEYGSKHTMPGTQIRIAQQGGLGNTVARDATAFPHRDTIFQCTVDVNWTDPKDAPKYKKFTNDAWDELWPLTNGGFYINTAIDPSEIEVRRAYAENYERLVELKNKYDPANFLKLNVNIKPSPET